KSAGERVQEQGKGQQGDDHRERGPEAVGEETQRQRPGRRALGPILLGGAGRRDRVAQQRNEKERKKDDADDPAEPPREWPAQGPGKGVGDLLHWATIRRVRISAEGWLERRSLQVRHSSAHDFFAERF